MDNKRIVLMCRDEFVEPFKQNGFEVFWTYPLVYPLFYEGNDRMQLKEKEFEERLDSYKNKILQFKPFYFLADQVFFHFLFNRLVYIKKDKISKLWIDFVDELNRMGIITIIICQDDPGAILVRRDVAPLTHRFQIVAAHSMQMGARYSKHGQKLIYSPTYIDAGFTDDYSGVSFEKKLDASIAKFDVFFVGVMTWKRKAFFGLLSRKIKDLDYFFGSKDFFYTSRSKIDFDLNNKYHVREIYAKSSINIVYGASDVAFIKGWGISNRIYNIAYCGGFFLCDYRKHMDNSFNIDPSLFSFKTVGQCHNKIRFYLENIRKREELADKFHKHVIEHCTVDKVVKKLIDNIEGITQKKH